MVYVAQWQDFADEGGWFGGYEIDGSQHPVRVTKHRQMGTRYLVTALTDWWPEGLPRVMDVPATKVHFDHGWGPEFHYPDDTDSRFYEVPAWFRIDHDSKYFDPDLNLLEVK